MLIALDKYASIREVAKIEQFAFAGDIKERINTSGIA
jgi:hypothetical protein